MTDIQLRRAIQYVAIANLAYFGVEFAVAVVIDSVSLFADSVDFLEDASVNLLILLALGWSLKARAKVGMFLASLLLIPGIATVWMAWTKYHSLTPPEPFALSIAGLGALVVNVTCAFMLQRFRHHKGSLTKAAFLSARNDAFANIAIIGAGFTTAAIHSAWPDLIVGIAIALMNAGAAFEVWEAARDEHLEAHS
ncbi:MAG: cation transporter [Proteobacteria bacterium]|nr:cation transporter [Pseudomonadota bacterium]